jgi:hypothetical protein
MFNEEQQLTFLDILSIGSFILAVKNLKLNNDQVNSLQKHLQEQDDNLLKTIIKQNEEIIKLLKGE